MIDGVTLNDEFHRRTLNKFVGFDDQILNNLHFEDILRHFHLEYTKKDFSLLRMREMLLCCTLKR